MNNRINLTERVPWSGRMGQMGNIERKMILAYVNTCRPITFYDKELHRDFLYFKIILEDEFHFLLEMDFHLANRKKGKVSFEEEPFCPYIEMLILELIREGCFAFVEAGTIQITKDGYQELVRLCKIADPVIPSVRYMVTRLKDYGELYKRRLSELKGLREA